jgi:hypothetical protein
MGRDKRPQVIRDRGVFLSQRVGISGLRRFLSREKLGDSELELFVESRHPSGS